MPVKVALSILLVFSAAAAFCAPPEKGKAVGQDFALLTPAVGAIYKGMPKHDLPLAGFNKETMLDYYTYDDMEFIFCVADTNLIMKKKVLRWVADSAHS